MRAAVRAAAPVRPARVIPSTKKTGQPNMIRFLYHGGIGVHSGVLMLLGRLALFLYGMPLMNDSLTAFAGEKLQGIRFRLTLDHDRRINRHVIHIAKPMLD